MLFLHPTVETSVNNSSTHCAKVNSGCGGLRLWWSSSDDVIISKNLDGIIISWNKGAERVFGYAAEEAIGQPITIVIPEDRHDEERQILTRIRRGEQIEHYETVRRRKHGSLIAVSLTVSPVRDAEPRRILVMP